MSSCFVRSSASLLVVLIALLAANLAKAQPPPRELTLDEALELAIEHNPELLGLEIERQRAELLVEREETARTPVFSADAGFRYGQSPDLSAQGTRLINSSSLSFSSRLSHVLPIGTQVAVRAAINRSARDSIVLGDLGLAYDAGVGVEATHPILRGAGRELIEAPIRSARLSREIQEMSRENSTSDVLLNVMTNYWDLWLASRSLEVQRDALEIARQNLRNAQARFEAGTIARADLAPLQIEVANAEERVLVAESTLRQRSTALASLLGEPPTSQYIAQAQAPTGRVIPSLEAALALHREQSQELKRAALQVEEAKIQAFLAKNQALPRLDAIGSFSLDGLDRNIGGALAQMSRFEGWVAFAGLRLELPVNNRSRQADAERAELSVESAKLNYQRLEDSLTGQLITALEQAETARARVDVAAETAELTRQNVDAQTARFEVGRGTTMEVIDALQRHREAEERVIQARVELERYLLTIENLLGLY